MRGEEKAREDEAETSCFEEGLAAGQHQEGQQGSCYKRKSSTLAIVRSLPHPPAHPWERDVGRREMRTVLRDEGDRKGRGGRERSKAGGEHPMFCERKLIKSITNCRPRCVEIRSRARGKEVGGGWQSCEWASNGRDSKRKRCHDDGSGNARMREVPYLPLDND